MSRILFFLTISTLFLGGCASITRGVQQSVSVKTTPVSNARCQLANSQGKWYVNRTPGSVVVHKSFSDLTVTCNKLGYRTGVTRVKSRTDVAIAGNAVIGGVIGAGLDAADGAAYDYPNEIIVPLRRK